MEMYERNITNCGNKIRMKIMTSTYCLSVWTR